MERRFGLKDLILVLLIAALLGSVWLAMLQYDRQYQDVQEIKGELNEIKSMLAQGVAVAGGAVNTNPGSAPGQLDPDDPFYRLRLARAEPGFAMGDWLVDAFSGGVAKITPLLSGDVYGSIVQGHVIETLATRDPETLEWRGLLAADWQIEDNSEAWQAYVDKAEEDGIPRDLLIAAVPAAQDDEQWQLFVEAQLKQAQEAGEASDAPPITAEMLERVRPVAREVPDAIVVRFTLRDEPRFSDGEPVTADDVVFSYHFIMNPEINAPRHRAYLSRIRGVEKLGEREVAFRFVEPYFQAFELAAAFEVLPEHFYSKFTPQVFNESVGLLMGSGPYMITPGPEAWKPGTLIQLVRNPRYWGEVSPAFNRYVYKEITNDIARLTAFRNGDVDVFAAQPEQYVAMTDDEDLLERTRNFDYASAIGGYRYIAWNQQLNGKATPFADQRVRQAMTMLIDRQRLIQEVMLGFANLATGPFNPLGKQYDPQIEPWSYDLSRAKELLKEAGYTDRDGDNVLEGPDGRPFRFALTYPSGSANYEKMVLFLKDSFARAGIVLEPDPLEWSVFTQRIENKNFQAITLAWTAGIETDIFQMFHSSQMLAGGDNFVSYRNPRLDEVIEQARTTVEEAERLPLWREAHRILHEDQPYTFLFFPNSLRFVDDRVANVKKVRLGLNPSEEWYVPAAKQKYTQ